MSHQDATTDTRTTYRQGIVLVLAGALVSSTIGIGVRLIENASAWQLLFYRSMGVVAFLSLVLVLRERGRLWQLIRGIGPASICGAVGLVFAFTGSIIAIQEATVANALFLFAAAPFLTAILGRLLLTEHVRLTTWAAIGLAFLGITVMVVEGISLGYLVGNIAGLAGALGFATFALALRWGRLSDMLPSVLLAGVFGTIVSAAMIGVSSQDITLTVQDTAIAFAMGVVQLGFSLILLTAGSKAVPAAELTLLAMAEIVLAPFWVWLVLGETAGPYTLLGGAILMAAIAGEAVSGLVRQRA